MTKLSTDTRSIELIPDCARAQETLQLKSEQLVTYKSITSGFPRLPIGDDNSLFDVSKHLEIFSEA